MDDRTRQAIARIDIKDLSRGTGSLVAPGIVLTALHVVGDRRTDPPQFYPGEIVLTFPGHTTKATPIDGLWNRQLDWCLLRCEVPPDVRPLAVSDLTRSDLPWASYGFPDSQPQDGMVYAGKVRNHRGELTGVPAYQLFSEEAAGGTGAPVKGLSGAPVLVEGSVVGLMRFALMKERQAVAGTLYACPVAAVVKGSGELLPVPDPVHGLPGLPHRPLPELPYRYLQRYTSADAEIFFGRDREIARLYHLVDDPDGPGLVLLYGQSGVGKSSFLDAGLFPRLTWHHRVRYLRRDPGTSVLDAVRRCLHEEAHGAEHGEEDVADPSWLEPGALWRAAEERHGKPVVVILDQLEEVYTHRRSGDELAELCDALRAVFAGEGRPRGRLVLGFRKEWYPEIAKRLEQAQLDFSRFFLEPLDQGSVEEAVAGLARTKRLHDRYGLTVEETLPAMIAHDLLADPDSPVAPTLQILLTKMWQQATGANAHAPAFTVQLYVRMKQDGVLLGDFLDQQVGKLRERHAGSVDSGLALGVLAQHTTPLLTSRECAAGDLERDFAHHADFASLMRDLGTLYLLVDSGADAAGKPRATRLAHDTLAPVVRSVADTSTLPGLRALRILQSREDWRDGAQGVPLGLADLATVENGLGGMRAPTPDEERLLAASRRERNRRVRARRVLRVVLAALAAGILVLSYFAFQEGRRADEKAFIAELDSSTSTVQRMLDAQPDLGLVTAIWAAGACYEEYRDEPHGGVRANLQLSLSEAVEQAREINVWPDQPLQGPVRAIKFNPNPDRLLIATAIGEGEKGADGTTPPGFVRLWNYDGAPVGTPMPHAKGNVNALAWTPAGNLLLSGGDDGMVRFWDGDGSPRGDPVALPEDVRVLDLAVDPSGKRFATGDDRGMVTLWDLATRRPLRDPIEAHAAGTNAVAFGPDGDNLVTGGRDGKVRIWKADGTWVGDYTGHTGTVHAVAIARCRDDVVRVASAGDDETVHIFELEDPAHKPIIFYGHNDDVTCVAFSSSGEYVVSGDRGNRVLICDLDGEYAAPPFNSPRATVLAVDYSPTIDNLIAVGGVDAKIRLRGPEGKQIGDTCYQFRTQSSAAVHVERGVSVESVAATPDGKRIVSAGGELDPAGDPKPGGGGSLCVWPDDAEGARLRRIDVESRVGSVVVTPDGSTVIGACDDGMLRRWNLDLEPLGEPVSAGQPAEFIQIALNPAGTRLASAYGRDVVLWDVENGSLRRRDDLHGHTGDVYAVAFNRDGSLLATGGLGHRVRLWTADGDPTEVTFEKMPHNEIYGLAFGLYEGAEVLYVAGSDSELRCYSLQGKLIDRVVAHSGSVRCVATCSDGKRIATGGKEGLVKLWTLSDEGDGVGLHLLAVMRWGHTKPVDSVAFTGPDDCVVVSGAQDGTTRLWHGSWRAWARIACRRLSRHPKFRLLPQGDERRRAAARYATERFWER